MSSPFVLVTPATRGLSLAITRQYLKSTKLPVFATYRSGNPEDVKKSILTDIKDVDPKRLELVKLDLTSEDSIESASQQLSEHLSKHDDPYLHTGFFTGGILNAEKTPNDINIKKLQEVFQINVLSHLLCIKYFSPFLPTKKQKVGEPSKWVHVSARVGSISDNKAGGWYSYRSSKAALNQVVKTFDNQLKMKSLSALAIGVHPGTVKTDLSKDYWESTPKEKLFEPEYSAERLVDVVGRLNEDQRGRVWDWDGKEVLP